ncbi:hypothetical protein HDU79_008224 [Rhizoclosmatium sp. JEL0117]|nr:hypothetical protein HDU79_008224 [Rhizoclosmatium sp. JEL0117]
MPANWLGSRSNLDQMDDVATEDKNKVAAPPSPIKRITEVAKPAVQKPNRRRILINTDPSKDKDTPTPPCQQQQQQPSDATQQSPTKEKDKLFEPASMGASNKVRTSKYTLISFLPKNLFEQFRSIANFYFLSLVVLQAFPPFALVSTLLTAAPILIIVCATAIKDAIEDWRRHQSDEGVNHSKTYLLANTRNWNFPPLTESLLKNKRRFIRKPSDLVAVLRHNGCENKNGSEHKVIISPSSPLSTPNPTPLVEKSRHSIFRASVASSLFGGADGKHFEDEGPFWQQNNWEDVRAGDFIFLQNGDSIPADVFIISTSEPDGACYVETKNLDGETNLKIRRGLPEFYGIENPGDCELIQGHVDSELPSANLFTYNGIIRVNLTALSQGTNGQTKSALSASAPTPTPTTEKPRYKTLPITMNSMLLRGCILRNTKWVIALAIYTGADTKIMLNSGITPSKRSKIDRQLNPLVILNFWILGAMCIICALISAVYTATLQREEALYNPSEGQYTPLYAAFVTFFSCLIIFQNIVPISLYISVDVSKTVQSLFISMDQEMYDPESDKYVSPRTWNLSDDLGQIEYIFSDKTGTLTCNMMEFRKCSINGIVYGGSFESSKNPDDTRPELEIRRDHESKMKALLGDMFDTKYLAKHLAFVDTQLPVDLKQGGEQARKIREFFSLLAVCHTVLVEKPEADVNPNHIEYRAQSPDEAALVAAARDVGFAFLTRNDDVAEIDLMGEVRPYKILNILEFNSDRKRMSIIIKRLEGQIILLVKGADSVVYDRLAETTDPNETVVREATLKHLEAFANQGLRTLCLAYKIIPNYEYESWLEKYKTAQNSMQNREKKVDEAADLIEHGLTLMGATAIEDRLQDGVPETIGTLAKAGLKIWVLTGDKMETAINIGFACNLLKRSMVLIVINSTSQKDTFIQLLETLEKFWTPQGVPRRVEKFALVIDGTSLKFALNATCRPLLLEIGCRCQAVICCRVSPLQKARVVSLVRKGLGAMCLAIGDGANDVSMIQEADIGIGISGKEGMQAVMASDYAIAQFRFLGKLLLVHGRWGYIRTAEIIFNYFYKNAVWLFLLLWYQFDCGFSADLITDFTYGMFFNTLFTLFPTMFIGFYEQDINADIGMQVPQAYRKGMKQTVFNLDRYWIYMLDAIWQSIIAYYFIVVLYSDSSPNRSGRAGDHDSMGAIMSYVCIICVNIHACVNTTNWTYNTFFGLIASYAIWIIYVMAYSTTFESPAYGQLDTLYHEPHFYLTIILTVVVCLFPRFFFKFVQQYIAPTDSDILLEIQKYQWKEGENLSLDIEQAEGPHLREASAAENVVRLNEGEEEALSPLKTVNSDNAFENLRKSTGRMFIPLKRSQSEHSVASTAQKAELSADGKSLQVTDLIAKHHFKTMLPAERKKTVRRSTTGLDEFKIKFPDGFAPIPVRRQKSEIFLHHKVLSGSIEWKTVDGMNEEATKAPHPTPVSLPPASPSRLTKTGTKASIFFMGTQEEVPNTGFCFSHDPGMIDMITPTATKMSKLDLDDIIAQPIKRDYSVGTELKYRSGNPVQRRSMTGTSLAFAAMSDNESAASSNVSSPNARSRPQSPSRRAAPQPVKRAESMKGKERSENE